MEDMATDQPGPMGWGTDGVKQSEAEKAYQDSFASLDPQMYVGNPAREPIDSAAVEAIKALQEKDGIEGGLSLSHIEPFVFGEKLNWLKQLIGSCVGSSFMRIATLRMLFESFVLGDPEEIFGTKLVGTNNVAPFAPYGYRAGRKLGGLNSGDGSFCSVQIRGAKEYGILPCSAPGLVSDAYPEPQNTRTYREMGNSNSFLEKFKPQATNFRLMESEQVRSADQAKTLIIDHFKPLQICSMWAFTPDYTHSSWRMANGDPVVIYTRDRRTSWAHAMSIVAFVQVSGKWFVIVKNSWGNAHRNGDWFAIPADLFDTWVRDAECMSIGDIEMTDNVLPGDV